MDYALQMAKKCWNRAYVKEPEFVEKYLELIEEYLLHRPFVSGDQLKDYCQQNKLYLPHTLHHNTWVSGVCAIQQIGWISPIAKVEPINTHNHMNDVTLWRSMIFNGKTPKVMLQLDLIDTYFPDNKTSG
jgi:hypothetical protein